MNKITRKRPNTMYLRVEFYRQTGKYINFSSTGRLDCYRKNRKEFRKFLKTRVRKSGRYCNTWKGYTPIIIEVKDYERRINTN